MDTFTLGLLIITGSITTGIIVVFSKGSLRLQKPEGHLISWIYNILNLFSLVVLTPLISILLLKNVTVPLQVFSLPVSNLLWYNIFVISGLVCFFAGSLFISWGRLSLWNNFRLGAVKPRSQDKLIIAGPFRIIRHPMYSGVVLINLGLTLVLQSGIMLILFIVILYAVLKMIPTEEAQLIENYGEEYTKYCGKVKRLIPVIY